MARSRVTVKRRNTNNLASLSAKGREKMKRVNEKAADEFLSLVSRIIPKGDPEDGNLINTLAKAPSSQTETGFRVSIGGPGQPYPFHLEVGHRAEDGTHVPGKNFWFPARRTIKRRRRREAEKALKDAVREVAR